MLSFVKGFIDPECELTEKSRGQVARGHEMGGVWKGCPLSTEGVKNAWFCAFLLQKTTCDQKLGLRGLN